MRGHVAEFFRNNAVSIMWHGWCNMVVCWYVVMWHAFGLVCGYDVVLYGVACMRRSYVWVQTCAIRLFIRGAFRFWYWIVTYSVWELDKMNAFCVSVCVVYYSMCRTNVMAIHSPYISYCHSFPIHFLLSFIPHTFLTVIHSPYISYCHSFPIHTYTITHALTPSRRRSSQVEQTGRDRSQKASPYVQTHTHSHTHTHTHRY